MKLSLRAFLVFLVIAMVLVASCGAPAPVQSPTPASQPDNPDFVVLAVGRDLGPGENRFPFALLSNDGQSNIQDRVSDLTVTYGPVDGPKKPIGPITWRAWPVLGGVYVAYPDFDSPGIWQVDVTLKDGAGTLTSRAHVQVLEKPFAPAIGDDAPRVETKTAASIEDLRMITSDPNPKPELYSVSLDDALKQGRVTLVTFATPAFCSSATCGPQVDVIYDLYKKYKGEVTFVHVEVWDNPREMLDKGDPSVGHLSPAVEAWRLQTEPWTFIIDKSGKIDARFESFTTADELEEELQRAISIS